MSKTITINAPSRSYSSSNPVHHNRRESSQGRDGRQSSSAPSHDIKSLQSIRPPSSAGVPNLDNIDGWIMPTEREIAKGEIPHFEIKETDNLACKIAKGEFNRCISYLFDGASDLSGFAAATEAIRIWYEFRQAAKIIGVECRAPICEYEDPTVEAQKEYHEWRE